MWYRLAQQLQLPGLDVERSAPKSKETSDPKQKTPELLETQKELYDIFGQYVVSPTIICKHT